MKNRQRGVIVMHSIMELNQLRASSSQLCLYTGQKLCVTCNSSFTLVVYQT